MPVKKKEGEERRKCLVLLEKYIAGRLKRFAMG